MFSLFGFGVGPWELAIVAFIVLLLFGSRLPSVMRSLGQGVVEFKKGVQGVDDPEEEQALPKKKNKNIKEEKDDEESEEAVGAHSKSE